MLLEDGEEVAVRLLDFGLAQFDGADTLTAVGDVPGTLAYIAPERLAGNEATPASDVWAVGVVLWEALAGRHPFWGMPLQEVGLAIERGAPPLASQRPNLPRRLLAAVDGALAGEPSARPRASTLAADLRAALRKPQPRPASRNGRPQRAVRDLSSPALAAPTLSALPLALAPRIAPAALAGAVAAIGVTLLPFWPSSLAVTIVLCTAAAAALSPRLGLALALAAPVFPLGNLAESAAVLYGAFAVSWFVLSWRHARRGLLFVAGPLLAWIGALGLVPLAVQPVRSPVQRAAQGALAVLAAGLVGALVDARLPLTGERVEAPGIAAGDSAGEIARGLWGAFAAHPSLPAVAALAGIGAAILPWARRRSRFGVACVGAATIAGVAAAGAPLAAMPLVVGIWAVAAALAAWTGR
jgi:hypothetical protein